MGKAKRKKEDMWNLKNIIKIVPKIFLFDPRHISLHPTCLWHPRYLSKTIIWTYLISKKNYRDKRETTLIFWDPVSPPREVPLGGDFGDPPFEIFCEWRNKIDKRIVSLSNCWSMFIKFSGICEYILDLWASLETSETLIFWKNSKKSWNT